MVFSCDLSCSIEIVIDESIKRTFSVLSFTPTFYVVQKVANREVRLRIFLRAWSTLPLLSDFRVVPGGSAGERTVS